mmetsp:Transcript_15217/g.33603  ORF Transcript_15217/g.33603 Transcript_15217/m.33603 type:complete len:93 (+) Transcript_15217:52-330(+)
MQDLDAGSEIRSCAWKARWRAPGGASPPLRCLRDPSKASLATVCVALAWACVKALGPHRRRRTAQDHHFGDRTIEEDIRKVAAEDRVWRSGR